MRNIRSDFKFIFLYIPTFITYSALIKGKLLQQINNIPRQTVMRACKGDNEARAQLYQQYSNAMYNICLRMTGNEEDAADLLQDAFVQAFEQLKQLKQPEAFGGWLKQIVVHRCIRFCKKTISWSRLEEPETTQIANEEEWWLDIPIAAIHTEIKNLPQGCRQVFVLFAMENFGHKEIADQLSISESTSKSQYHRAKKLLRERITKHIQIHGQV